MPSFRPLSATLLGLLACSTAPDLVPSDAIDSTRQAIACPNPPWWTPAVETPQALPGTQTSRITQISGDSDPDGLFHVNKTGLWDAPGIDLGPSVDHDGRTYIFFGDAPKASDATRHDLDPIAYLEKTQVAPGTKLAYAQQGGNQSDLFYIGSDGALYGLWSANGEAWRGPQRFSTRGLAPAGAPIVTAYQTNTQLDVFFVGNDGGIYVAWVVGTGTWQGPQRITNPGIAPVGAALAAAKPTANELDVFFVDSTGALSRTWVAGSGIWNATGQRITSTGIAPAGANLATVKQDSQQLDVFFVGNYRKPIVVWARDGAGWSQNLHQLGGTCTLPPGAPLAIGWQGGNQLDVFGVGDQGGPCVAWLPVGLPWYGPQLIGAASVAPPGAIVSAATRNSNRLDVTFVGNGGAVSSVESIGYGAWTYTPLPITPPGTAPAGSSVVSFPQLTTQATTAFVANDGIPNVSWVVGGSSTWGGPARASSGTFMTPVLQNGRFYPFTVRENGATHPLGTAQTPTGAFSWQGRVYVFAAETTAPGAPYYSSLSSSATPDQPVPYDLVLRLSNNAPANHGKFYQVAPVVVNNAEIPGLPQSSGNGVVMFGQGWDAAGVPGVHLAWMALNATGPVSSTLRYFTGNAATPWSLDEAAATRLFTTQWSWSAISARRLTGANATPRWAVMTQRTWYDDCTAGPGWLSALRERIEVRVASSPMDIGSAQPYTAFDPTQAGAYGRWMHEFDCASWPSRCGAQNDALEATVAQTRGPHPSMAYGAHFLGNRSTLTASGGLVLEYLLSSGKPYNVQLMRTSMPPAP